MKQDGRMGTAMQFITKLCLALLVCCSAAASLAQGSFQPVVTVNNSAVTAFELDQRKRMLEVFRTPGDLDKLALEALIEERLKLQAMNRAGLSLAPDSLRQAMEDFAGRANLNLDQFLQVLAQNGVAAETLRDFVKMGVTWRDFIRTQYGQSVSISDADVNRAMSQAGGAAGGIEVLLSEIIIPAPPPRAAAAMATARQISQIRSTAAFEAQARRVSALPSKRNGGRLGWLPLSNYPPQLHGLLLGLAPGEVTQPLPITNGVALFQMRAIREVPRTAPVATEVEYATYFLAGGKTPAGIAAARALQDRVDTCDDLYGEAQGQAAEVLDRKTSTPADLPQDVALELARLDRNEASYNLTTPSGETLIFLMLCDRTLATAEGVNPEAVRNQLRSRQLAARADALLSQLRASATITYP